MQMFRQLPWFDWVALLIFFGGWLGYATFSRRWGAQHGSLIVTTNRYRRRWMLQATARDPRVLDSMITQNLSQTPAFFSSTTIIIIGGLIALLGTTDRAVELIREVPFAVRTSVAVFDFKVLLILGIYVFAFFRFTWSMRIYTFAAITIGSMPPPADFESGRFNRERFAERAGELAGTAAETFNDGLRAYYFSFAAMAWVLSPLIMIVATALVVLVLYVREFRSHVLHILRD